MRSPSFAGIVIGVIALFLGIDQFVDVQGQLLLGAATWAVLIWACAGLAPDERARVALVVVVATCAEVLGSIVLGVYEYRLSNLPAFVPPGHGLVYLGGLAISGWVIERGRQREFIAGVIAFVAVWGGHRPARARPHRPARRARRRPARLLPASRPRPDALRRRLPDRRLPRDLRHRGRCLELGRADAGHRRAGRKPAERHRQHLRALRHRRDRAGAAPARRGRRTDSRPDAESAGSASASG